MPSSTMCNECGKEARVHVVDDEGAPVISTCKVHRDKAYEVLADRAGQGFKDALIER